MASELFNQYYDKVTLEKKLPLDKTGVGGYSAGVEIKVREVKSSNVTEVTNEKTTVKRNKKYHVPCEYEIENEDKIDGRKVINVRPSRGLFGQLHFWIVEVI